MNQKIRCHVTAVLLLLLAGGCGPTATPAPSPTPVPRIRLTIAAVPAGLDKLAGWIVLYREEHPTVALEVLPQTASHAHEALAQGVVELALLDQDPTLLDQDPLTVTWVADLPIAIVVHPENRLGHLSSASIKEIFGGRVTDWGQVGGDSIPLQVYLPPASAGEVGAFEAAAMAGRRLSPQAIVRSSADSVAQAVAGDIGGIGLLPASEVSAGVVILRIDGALPREEGYSWHMPLYLAYGPASPEQARGFIRFVEEIR